VRILVAGSEGSLMQSTIPHLLRKGHEVRGVDNFLRYGRIQRRRDYEFIEGDLCDRGFVKKVFKGREGVIQAAAHVYGVLGFHKYGADILSLDVQLHQNILWEALSQGVEKVVYISSSMVYERCNKMPVSEEDTEDMPVPHTDYGLSKLMGERLCQAFYRQYGLKYTIWRPFNIITPHEKGEEQPGISHVFADLIRKILLQRQKRISIFGDGEQIRCFTWIEDIAQAIADYSFEKITDCETFNLGSQEPVTVKELAGKIFQIAKQRGLFPPDAELEFEHLPSFPDDVRVRIPSIKKAQEVLGWRPKTSLDQALKRCVDHALRAREV